MKSRVVFAAIVAFVVGAGAGGLGEHVRLRQSSDTAVTTLVTGETGDWYGSRATAACPALKRWAASVAATVEVSARPTVWAKKRAELAAPVDASGAAYQALLPLATPAGKAELGFLLAYQKQMSAALHTAASSEVYSKAQKALLSARLTRDLAIVAQGAQACSKR